MKLRTKKLALILALAMVSSVAVMGCGRGTSSNQASNGGSSNGEIRK